jgi:carbon monoxide dehydrogenase subunit G
VSSEWTSEGPVGVGSTQHSVDKFLGRNIESDSEITVWDPPNEYGWKSVGGPIPYELSMKFTPDGGGTQISFGGQAELGGFLKLAEGMAGKQMEKQMDDDFNNLKAVLEAG